MKITGILMVHNEEALVEHALRSMRPGVDERIVCQDGPCRDRSLERARPFADAIHVADFRGAPEANCIKMLRVAQHDWVLRIDCDETLSAAMIDALLGVKAEGPPEDVTHYLGVWHAVWEDHQKGKTRADLERDLVPGPDQLPGRQVLFRKSAARWVGIPHRTAVLSGRGIGIHQYVLHWAPHQQYSALELLTRKMIPFARNDAQIRVVHPLEVFGYDGVSPRECLDARDRLRHEFPLLSALPLAGLSSARAMLHALKSRDLADLRGNLRWPLVHGAYQLLLAYNIFRFKRRPGRSTLAGAS